MRNTVLRTVQKIVLADVLQLGNDPRLFRVVAVERSPGGPDARCKVMLRSLDDEADVMLVRAGRELVQVVLNPPATQARPPPAAMRWEPLDMR